MPDSLNLTCSVLTGDGEAEEVLESPGEMDWSGLEEWVLRERFFLDDVAMRAGAYTFTRAATPCWIFPFLFAAA